MRYLHLLSYGNTYSETYCSWLRKYQDYLLKNAREHTIAHPGSLAGKKQNCTFGSSQNSLIENIQTKRKITTDTIAQAKQETLDFVNRYFDAKEKDIMRKVEADEKKLGLHNENRMDTLNNLISRDINNLFAAAQDLNSANFLESFHRIRTQVLANSLQTQLEISD